jgi:molecular chaperone DnaK
MKIRKTVGIDLGTTNSVIALLDATDSALLTGCNEQGRMTFPSVVGYDATLGRLVTGRDAQALRGPPVADASGSPVALPLSSVKRFMGLDRRFTLGPEALSPPEASAHILRLLRDVLARTLNDPTYLLDSAVITMPAYFNHEQIEATRQAGELAGFDVVELLHEPTAAAIYYSWLENHGDATYLVYDLGGGTFDVSVIRRRLGDYEVLSVSGDPFLGGDDFDRQLASHLAACGFSEGGTQLTAERFDLSKPEGGVNFARLVHIAEGIKIELSDTEHVRRAVPEFLPGADFEASVDRATFNRLIKDKVDRTIDCCHEALARARERAGVRLGDIDFVILVGGSSRVPLVRERVQAAFCNPDLPEHVRRTDPLLHEPDLCVAYGAALRAGTHGTRFIFPTGDGLELRLTSPMNTRETQCRLSGIVRLGESPALALGPNNAIEGASVRVRSLATGLTDEAFLDGRGTFAQEIELQPETDNALELAICDVAGEAIARVVTAVRHRAGGRPLGRAVLPTQLITKPLQIEVLNHGRQRVKQVIAPAGATLPGVFHCTCRTRDQAGRVVVPIFEENRVIKEMVVDNLDRSLPVGSPVEIELAIDVKHSIAVRVRVRQGESGERTETATIEPAPPAKRPTRAEIDDVQRRIEELLPQFSGAFRSQARARANRLRDDLLEALRYDDEPKSVQRMAELRDLLQQLETGQGLTLEPPWPRFAQLVRHCLGIAVSVAKSTDRDREELFEYVHAQERYAEKAYDEHNQALYRECRENLEKYAGYLDGLLRDALPQVGGSRNEKSPEEEARDGFDRFRAFLTSVWKRVRAKQRADLDARLKELARQADGLSRRLRSDPVGVIRDVRRLGTEVAKIEESLEGKHAAASGDDTGLLEGSR